jgi:hypothetical protein
VFAGEPSAETEITGDVSAILRNDAPEYVILQSPGGLSVVTWVAIALVATAVVVSLIPKPEVPNSAVNRTQSSPNNALGQRTNAVRMLERVEDIFGTVKSIPSLMMPTYNKYMAHQKYEYGYYCVSRGYCDIADLKDGDTPISAISGASASVYHPFTSPNSGAPVLQVGNPIIDDVISARRAIEVDGITLKAPNQAKLPSSGVYTFSPGAGGNVISQASSNPNFNSVCAPGDTLIVSMPDYVVTTGEWHNTDHIVVDSTEADHWHVTSTTTYNYSGTYTVAASNDGSVTLEGTGWPVSIPSHAASVQVSGATESTDWVTLPDEDRTQVWCNVIAPNGMYKDRGGKVATSVSFEIEIERLEPSTLAPTGTVETVMGSLTGAVTDERADTIEQTTAWVGPCRVRMRRTNDYDYGFPGTIQDEIKWADLYSVSPVTKPHFGNKTTIHTITQATSRATAVKSRQLNCIASRRLPTFNGSTFSGVLDDEGRLISGTIAPTSKLCDIIAAVSVDKKIGARSLADVDMTQIWGIQQQLDAWDSRCGQFNYTLDNDGLSYEETLVLIANAGFCIAYRQNGKIRLALDRLQPVSTALFTHRNKKPNSETITRRFVNDADYDGVEFTYMDPDSQQNETITLPLDGNYTKLKKFEIAGIRSFAQAWYRANREYRKLAGQRLSIETTTTLDARALLPNTRVDIVDNTRFKSFDGEVVGQNGLELTLSRAVEFTPGQPHSIVLMRRDGSLQSIPVTPGSTSKSVVLQSLPTEALVTDYGVNGVRSIYSFAADSARSAMAWLVQEVDVSDGQYCAIKAINYSPDYYASDTMAVPDKGAIIN